MDGVLSRESMCKGSVVFVKSMSPLKKKHSADSQGKNGMRCGWQGTWAGLHRAWYSIKFFIYLKSDNKTQVDFKMGGKVGKENDTTKSTLFKYH